MQRSQSVKPTVESVTDGYDNGGSHRVRTKEEVRKPGKRLEAWRVTLEGQRPQSRGPD